MAYMRQAKTEEEIKALTLSKVKVAYNTLAEDYNKLIELQMIYCPQCGDWKRRDMFYSDKRSKSGLNHFACKSCFLEMATDYNKQTKERTDNRDKTISVFRILDIPFIEDTYKSQLQMIYDDVAEKQRTTAYQQLLTLTKSLPQYKGKTFADSQFDIEDTENNTEENTKIVQKTLKIAKKRFGTQYSNEDLMFLENEYEDWISHYQVDTKAQETIFERLAFKKWEIQKATIAGASTKDLDKTYQDLLASINILPKQNAGNGVNDSLSFGQLIEKWEEEKPIPEPEEEFKDVDGIGKYIRVWFKGHLARVLGLDNGYSKEYDEYIDQYTVKKPEYDEDSTEEDIYEKVFGSNE